MRQLWGWLGFLSNSLLGTPWQPRLFKVRIKTTKENKQATTKDSISIEIFVHLNYLCSGEMCFALLSPFSLWVLFLIRITN